MLYKNAKNVPVWSVFGILEEKTMMESVLDRVIKQNTQNANLLKTKDYNIFSVLQIQSKEVLTCRMIADFLNPRGQHGAGAEYLKIFLRDCLGMEKMDTKLAESM